MIEEELQKHVDAGPAAAAAGADARAERARTCRRRSSRSPTSPIRRRSSRRSPPEYQGAVAQALYDASCASGAIIESPPAHDQRHGIFRLPASSPSSLLAAWGASRALERLVSPTPAGADRAGLGRHGRRPAHHRDAVLRHRGRPGASRRQARGAAGGGRARAGPRRSSKASWKRRPRRISRSSPRARCCARSTSPTQGDAFVDLSPEVSTAHPGGSINELLTVYADRQRGHGQPVLGSARADPDRRQGSGHARGPRRPAPSLPARHVAGAADSRPRHDRLQDQARGRACFDLNYSKAPYAT